MFSYKPLTSGELVVLMVLDRTLLTRDSLTQPPQLLQGWHHLPPGHAGWLFSAPFWMEEGRCWRPPDTPVHT